MVKSLIDEALGEINKEYTPGLLASIKLHHPDHWGRMRQIEDRINQVALSGDEAGLISALSDYQSFFRESLK